MVKYVFTLFNCYIRNKELDNEKCDRLVFLIVKGKTLSHTSMHTYTKIFSLSHTHTHTLVKKWYFQNYFFFTVSFLLLFYPIYENLEENLLPNNIYYHKSWIVLMFLIWAFIDRAINYITYSFAVSQLQNPEHYFSVLI